MKVPLPKTQVQRMGDGVYFAHCTVMQDENCPYGVFPTAVAVDRTPETASRRAQFEAAERYALAAVDSGHEMIEVEDPTAIISPALRLRQPFLSSGGPTRSCLRISESYGEIARFAAVADLFAPYPILLGHSQWHPTTNGVAIGRCYSDARINSLIEFVERHSIMEFWFLEGKGKVLSIEKWSSAVDPEISLFSLLGYELIAIEISATPFIKVVLAVAVQKEGHYPYFVCAAGAAVSTLIAVEKAFKECVQSLVAASTLSTKAHHWNLRGQPVHNLDDRMIFYGHPSNRPVIDTMFNALLARCSEGWCEGFDKDITPTEILGSMNATAAFIDISPASWREDLFCVRCLSSKMLPLIVDEQCIIEGRVSAHLFKDILPHPFP